MRRWATFSVVWLFILSPRAFGGDNGLAQKPYMGWSSWSYLKKDKLNEEAVMAQADVMAEKLKKYGYTYINIDAGWHNDKDFDANGRRMCDSSKFPRGMKFIGDYLHSKGLKFGLYIEPGMPVEAYNQNGTILGTNIRVQEITDATQFANTLGKNFYRIDFSKPGAREWLESEAELLASYGVDFIKLDFVGPSSRKSVDTRDEVKLWYTALQKRRPVWFELSNNLRVADAQFWQQCSNGWRIGGDIEAPGKAPKPLTVWSRVVTRFRDAPKWTKFAGKGGWNDLDSIIVGNGEKTGLSLEERRTVMTLWCISCAPLYLGVDLTDLADEDLPIITNTEAITLNQAGVVATPLSQDQPEQVWTAKNADGSYTVALFNLADKPSAVAVNWADIGITGAAQVRDLWSHTDLGDMLDGFSADLESHCCRLLKVTPKK